jgi:hypothetical protein
VPGEEGVVIGGRLLHFVRNDGRGDVRTDGGGDVRTDGGGIVL